MSNGELQKTWEEEAYNMVATSSLTLWSLTPPEIRQFRKLQKQTKEILSKDELPAHISWPLRDVLSEAKDDMENGDLWGMIKLFALLSPDKDITKLDEKSSLDDIAVVDLDEWAWLINFLEKPKTEHDLKKDLSSDLVTKLDKMEAEELVNPEKILEKIPEQNQIA